MARHEHVYAALNDPETFCSSAGVGLSDFRKETPWRPPSLLLEADPPDHTRARHAITKVLSPTVVRSLRETFTAEAVALFDRLEGRADPSLARGAFEEVVRYEAPVQTFFRTTTREVEVGGTAIPAGDKVLLFLGAANRDPRQWGEDAHRFDITRKATGHVGFGSGIHTCVGQMMARLEGEIVLTELARRVSTVDLAGTPVRQLSNTLRGLDSLPLHLTYREA
jgi:cytochrome P450